MAGTSSRTTGGRHTRTFIDQVVRHSLDNSAVEAFAAYLGAMFETPAALATSIEKFLSAA
ncbi:MAG TPA: hypothetical protein VGG75_39895 [Trebonia sp.]|jgi:fido (protein-threonine AMPylation protein)